MLHAWDIVKRHWWRSISGICYGWAYWHVLDVHGTRRRWKSASFLWTECKQYSWQQQQSNDHRDIGVGGRRAIISRRLFLTGVLLAVDQMFIRVSRQESVKHCHMSSSSIDSSYPNKSGALKMQEWKIQELKHMESRPYRNLWRSKLQSGCVWLSMVESRQFVTSPTELTGLVPRVGVIHFDVETDSVSGAQKLRVFILLLYSVFFADVCVQRIW